MEKCIYDEKMGFGMSCIETIALPGLIGKRPMRSPLRIGCVKYTKYSCGKVPCLCPYGYCAPRIVSKSALAEFCGVALKIADASLHFYRNFTKL